VHAGAVDALVVGEHGTSHVPLWSSATVGGTRVTDLLDGARDGDDSATAAMRKRIEDDIRYANITIIEGTGASQYGIGIVSARLIEAVLRDERAVLPVAAYVPEYGTTLSLVGVLGAGGVRQIRTPSMTVAERAALHRGADILRKASRAALAQILPDATLGADTVDELGTLATPGTSPS
jgi:L-lactate dehydrogenase